jgi:hypothetical protein
MPVDGERGVLDGRRHARLALNGLFMIGTRSRFADARGSSNHGITLCEFATREVSVVTGKQKWCLHAARLIATV